MVFNYIYNISKKQYIYNIIIECQNYSSSFRLHRSHEKTAKLNYIGFIELAILWLIFFYSFLVKDFKLNLKVLLFIN